MQSSPLWHPNWPQLPAWMGTLDVLPKFMCVCTSLLQEQQRLFDTMEAQGILLQYTHCMASFMPTTELAYAEQLVKLAAGTPNDCQHTPSSDLPDRQQCQHTAGNRQRQAPPLIQMPNWLATWPRQLQAASWADQTHSLNMLERVVHHM